MREIKEKPIDPMRAYNYVLFMQGRRDYSEKELRTKMKMNKFQQEDIDFAIQKAKDNNLQSDLRFAQIFVKYKTKYGQKMLKYKLKEKGISDKIIEEVLTDLPSRCLEVLEKIKTKKQADFYKENDPDKYYKKIKPSIINHMLGKGFNFSEFAEYL